MKDVKNKSNSERNLYALVDGIIVEEVRNATESYRVLEMGSGNGKLSFHLATLMGTLNPESLLCYVGHVLDKDGAGKWQDNMSAVTAPPRLAMVLSDCEDIPLETGTCDLLIMNRSISDECSLKILRECKRLLKDGGKAVCHVKAEWNMEKAFKELFSKDWDVQEISATEKVLSAICEKEITVSKEESLEQKRLGILKELNDILMRDGRKMSYKNVVKQMDQYLEEISELDKEEKEEDFYQLKECVLNYMFNLNDEFASYYRRKVMEQIEKMKSC